MHSENNLAPSVPTPSERQRAPDLLSSTTPKQLEDSSFDLLPTNVAIDPKLFPHQPRGGSFSLPCTIENIEYMLSRYGMEPRYDIIKKKLILIVPGLASISDDSENTALSIAYSISNLNGIASGALAQMVSALAMQNPTNPVAAWIGSKPWDKVDRLLAFYETLVVREEYPTEFRNTLIRRWLISAVAAALMPSRFHARGVLTLQGPQSIGKSTWIRSLIDDPMLAESVIKMDHHMDAGSKDSLIAAVSHWVVEIGELDSSFKKDVARLKGFLTADRDKVRKPYARAESDFQRRTVFAATVNDEGFLVDTTGNSRWWVIPVEGINYNHGIDMQQLWAQVAVEYTNGEQWWLTRDEELQLGTLNKNHQSANALRELIYAGIDHKRIGDEGLPNLATTDVLRAIGYRLPTNPQCKEAKAILQELLGPPKRSQGRTVWRVPMKINNSEMFSQI